MFSVSQTWDQWVEDFIRVRADIGAAKSFFLFFLERQEQARGRSNVHDLHSGLSQPEPRCHGSIVGSEADVIQALIAAGFQWLD